MSIIATDKKYANVLYVRPVKLVVLMLFSLAIWTKDSKAQSIQIKLVNGLNGQPWTGKSCLSVWLGNRPRQKVFVIGADSNGIVRLSLTDKDSAVSAPKVLTRCGVYGTINPTIKYDESLSVETIASDPSCAIPEDSPKGRWKSMNFTTDDVIHYGAVSINTCGSATASPKPGELIIFVRARSRHEKVEDWKNSDTFPF